MAQRQGSQLQRETAAEGKQEQAEIVKVEGTI
jgi:hypothetical protein